jgi:hypothetical protein
MSDSFDAMISISFESIGGEYMARVEESNFVKCVEWTAFGDTPQYALYEMSILLGMAQTMMAEDAEKGEGHE